MATIAPGNRDSRPLYDTSESIDGVYRYFIVVPLTFYTRMFW